MSVITNAPPHIAAESLPAVPLTLEGASLLHQMLRVRWTAWKQLAPAERAGIAQVQVPSAIDSDEVVVARISSGPV